MNYFDHARQTLIYAGYKITASRRLVLRQISQSKIPQNAQALTRKIISKKESIDVVSVYRILALLKKLDLIHEISKGKFIACQKPDCKNKKHSHHSFICSRCHNTEEIHINDDFFIKKLKKKFPQFHIQSHQFLFSGLCKICQK